MKNIELEQYKNNEKINVKDFLEIIKKCASSIDETDLSIEEVIISHKDDYRLNKITFREFDYSLLDDDYILDEGLSLAKYYIKNKEEMLDDDYLELARVLDFYTDCNIKSFYNEDELETIDYTKVTLDKNNELNLHQADKILSLAKQQDEVKKEFIKKQNEVKKYLIELENTEENKNNNRYKI